MTKLHRNNQKAPCRLPQMGQREGYHHNLARRIIMTDPASILDDHRPVWHVTLVDTSDHVHHSVNGLLGASQGTKHDLAICAYGAETKLALTQLQPLITDMKNSWSNNFKAKVSLQHKTHAAMDIATEFLVALMLHGLSSDDAYTNLYELICPHLSYHCVTKEQMDVLAKILGDFNGTGLKMEKLEQGFLEKHPGYAHGTKRKWDPKMSADKVCWKVVLVVLGLNLRPVWSLVIALSLYGKRLVTIATAGHLGPVLDWKKVFW